jgi:hypothetical protein
MSSSVCATSVVVHILVLDGRTYCLYWSVSWGAILIICPVTPNDKRLDSARTVAGYGMLSRSLEGGR